MEGAVPSGRPCLARLPAKRSCGLRPKRGSLSLSGSWLRSAVLNFKGAVRSPPASERKALLVGGCVLGRRGEVHRRASRAVAAPLLREEAPPSAASSLLPRRSLFRKLHAKRSQVAVHGERETLNEQSDLPCLLRALLQPRASAAAQWLLSRVLCAESVETEFFRRTDSKRTAKLCSKCAEARLGCESRPPGLWNASAPKAAGAQRRFQPSFFHPKIRFRILFQVLFAATTFPSANLREAPGFAGAGASSRESASAALHPLFGGNLSLRMSSEHKSGCAVSPAGGGAAHSAFGGCSGAGAAAAALGEALQLASLEAEGSTAQPELSELLWNACGEGSFSTDALLLGLMTRINADFPGFLFHKARHQGAGLSHGGCSKVGLSLACALSHPSLQKLLRRRRCRWCGGVPAVCASCVHACMRACADGAAEER